MKNVIIGLLIVCGLAGGGCFLSMDWEGAEISRVKSPSGAIEAVVVEGSAGATTYVVPTGMATPKTPGESEVFRADHTSNLSVSWKTNGILDINFNEARIFHFRNFWKGPPSWNVVEVRLRAKDPDALLPIGDR